MVAWSGLIYCVACEKDVKARLTDGKEIYPHRADLAKLPFWKCDACRNYVGCHHKTKNRTRPLGLIPTKELRNARKHIHALIDPWWKEKGVDRQYIYHWLTDQLGWEYHTAKIRSVEEARDVYRKAIELKKCLQERGML